MGKVYLLNFFVALFFGIFPTYGLCASFCNENARENIG